MSIMLSKLDRTMQDETIMKPFKYINKVPSKYHKTIGLAFNHWLKIPENKVEEIGEILQIIHTASLLIDDIQDDSKLRYGVPVAHHVHGLGQTINAASNALVLAFKKVLALDHPKAIDIYLEAILDGHRGQGIEIYWRDNHICPSEEEYIDMLKQKSAAFFVLAVQFMQLFSDSKEDYVGIAVAIGVYYAIRDDYCNIFNQQALKTLAEDSSKLDSIGIPDNDITEGKFTLPIIHAMQNTDNFKQIFNILKQRTKNIELIRYCTTLLEKSGSAAYTEDVLRRLEEDIYKEISRLGENPILTGLMKQLGDWKRNNI